MIRQSCPLLQGIKVTTSYGYNQTKSDSDLVDLAESELFHDLSREQPAVHAALRDLVMTPEALLDELNPDPKKAKKKAKK